MYATVDSQWLLFRVLYNFAITVDAQTSSGEKLYHLYFEGTFQDVSKSFKLTEVGFEIFINS